MNRWGIPEWLEREVVARDRHCVYCRNPFDKTAARSRHPSWEHIINDGSIVTRGNIVLCCVGCNASKGIKPLQLWLQSSYCKERGITEASVAPIIQAALALANGVNGEA
jgi:hypothetical protein